MKNNNSIVLVVIAFILLSSCTSILNKQFYQVSRFPNNNDKASLLFLTDTTGQIISSASTEDFKYRKVNKYTYVIESNTPYNTPLLNELTKDTIVIYKNKLYYSGDSLKLVFSSKKGNSK